MSKEQSKPAPLETEDGEQMDDNINDAGEKSGDKRQEQPVDGGAGKPDDKTKR